MVYDMFIYIFRFLRLAQYAGRRISVRHFPYKFQRKLHFGKYRYIFRLRRFAQNVGAGLEFRIFSINFHIKWLLGNVLIYFDRAGSHKVRFPVLRSIVFLIIIMFLLNFRFIIFPSPSCSYHHHHHHHHHQYYCHHQYHIYYHYHRHHYFPHYYYLFYHYPQQFPKIIITSSSSLSILPSLLLSTSSSILTSSSTSYSIFLFPPHYLGSLAGIICFLFKWCIYIEGSRDFIW